MRPAALIFLFCLIAALGHSQPATDSPAIKRMKAAYALINTNPDSAIFIANASLHQGRHPAAERLRAWSYNTRGWALYRTGNYDSGLVDLLRATRLFIQLRDTIETMHLYTSLAIVYSSRSQFSQSAAYAMKADSLARIKKDPEVEAAIKRQLGILYRQQDEIDKAIAYFKESLALYVGINDSVRIWDVVTSLAITYNSYLGKPDSSLPLLKKYAPLVEAIKGPTYQKASMHEQFGDTYYALADYNEALGNYKAAYAIFASQDRKADMYYEAMDIGKAYVQLKNYAEAERFLLQAYKGDDSLRMINYKHDAASQLAALYKKKGDWQKAYRWFETKFWLYDSMRIAEQHKKAEELETKYETAKKDAEIAILKKDQELDRLTLQKQKTFRYGSMTLLGLLALIAFLFINRYRIIQRAKRLVELERLRNNIARDLHDDMGSSLSSINIISKVAMESPDSSDNIRGYFKKIRDNSGFMMESMSDIVWAINPVNDNFESVVFKMKEFAASLLEPLNIRYEFAFTGEPSSVDIGLDRRKDLYLIFKEAINNIAKYSGSTIVLISLVLNKGGIILKVKDDGHGFDVGNTSRGNGLRNMKQRAALMGGSATITSAKGKGTTVTLYIHPAAGA